MMQRPLPALLGIPLALTIALAPVHAQDDTEVAAKGAHFYLEIDSWMAQPVGLDYSPASVNDPANLLGEEVITMGQDINPDAYYRFAFDVGNNVGEFSLTWYTQTADVWLQDFRPGSFVFGETQAHPLLAGYSNDGRADGVYSEATTELKDFRFDFSREAFRSDKLVGRWFVGIRSVNLACDFFANYYALAPLQPPLIPPVAAPRPDLDPNPDVATIQSSYHGRGFEGGMDFDVPLVKKRMWLDAGFSIAVLRGKIDTFYDSQNWYYLYTDPSTMETTILGPPYDFSASVPGDGVVADNTTQDYVSYRVTSQNLSRTSPLMELYLGLRGRVWKRLDLLVGFRTVYYGDVGLVLRAKTTSVTDAGANVVDVTETSRSVEYEGLYLGAAYTF